MSTPEAPRAELTSQLGWSRWKNVWPQVVGESKPPAVNVGYQTATAAAAGDGRPDGKVGAPRANPSRRGAPTAPGKGGWRVAAGLCGPSRRGQARSRSWRTASGVFRARGGPTLKDRRAQPLQAAAANLFRDAAWVQKAGLSV